MHNVINSLVLLKFYYGHKDSVNPMISKTMGRVSIINYAYTGPQPQAGTIWLCRIDKENFDKSKPEYGCYVVSPIREVGIVDVVKLIPNCYTVEEQGNTVILKPKIKDLYWLCPFSIKSYFLKQTPNRKSFQSVVVPLELNDSMS